MVPIESKIISPFWVSYFTVFHIRNIILLGSTTEKKKKSYSFYLSKAVSGRFLCAALHEDAEKIRPLLTGRSQNSKS